MDIDGWWPRLSGGSRQWLIDHNGEAVPPEIVSEIAAVGGVIVPDAWWVGEDGTGGFSLSDRAIDWIEAVANDESGS